MKLLSFLCTLLLLAGTALAGELEIRPETIDNGGVALVRWQGEGFAAGKVVFDGETVPLITRDEGAVALLGVDLDASPGDYPVSVQVDRKRGSSETYRRTLQVAVAARAEEHLSLPDEMVSPRSPQTLARIVRERDRLAALFSGAGGPPLWQGFARPVDDPMGSPFGLRRILNGKPRSPHSGVDFRSLRGTVIKTPARGRVVLVDDLFFTGKTVVLDHGAGLYSYYAHLEKARCREGEMLDAGTPLGTVGSSGRSTGPHLHWGVKLRGDRIDPLALVELLGREKP